jgi:hypothetical protein
MVNQKQAVLATAQNQETQIAAPKIESEAAPGMRRVQSPLNVSASRRRMIARA